jgi:hypothetical protein
MMATLRSLVVLALAVGAACENNEDPEDRHRAKVQYVSEESEANGGGGDIIIFEYINSEDDENGPNFTAASETEPRRDKDLSRAAPAPRPAPRPCTTTKEPVLKPNPYEGASEPGDTIAATTGGGGTAEDSRKDRTLVHTVDVPIARPQDTSAGDSKEPDVDILIDSDGS